MLKDVLKSERQKRNMSQSDVAAALKITRQAYNNYETGIREPSLETLNGIAALFSVSTDYLLGREEKDEKSLDEKLDGVDFAFFSKFKELTPNKKKAVLNLLDALGEDDDEEDDKG